MKSDSERKKYYKEGLHQRKSRLHVHLSKTLRSKLKTRKRAVLVHKSDKVKIMRGPGIGKEGRVTRVNVTRRKVFTDAVLVKNARGTEVPVALEPSNLLLIELEPTRLRKELFKDDAFIKEKPKEAPKPKEDGQKKEEKTEHLHHPHPPEKELEQKHATHEDHRHAEHAGHEKHHENEQGSKHPSK